MPELLDKAHFEFQFLIGKVKTEIKVPPVPSENKFQFLIGKVKTFFSYILYSRII